MTGLSCYWQGCCVYSDPVTTVSPITFSARPHAISIQHQTAIPIPSLPAFCTHPNDPILDQLWFLRLMPSFLILVSALTLTCSTPGMATTISLPVRVPYPASLPIFSEWGSTTRLHPRIQQAFTSEYHAPWELSSRPAPCARGSLVLCFCPGLWPVASFLRQRAKFCRRHRGTLTPLIR